ncbi:MAG: ABC transporter ATP-binding protein [Oligoflexales bacterium]|nr:ABC transporter ATP-binding protein [Oligoflexales bacterium]
MTASLLEVKNLVTSFKNDHGSLRAVDQVSFSIKEKQTVAIVGESGCGKSVTALSILRLIESPPGQIESGTVVYKEQDLLKLSPEAMRGIRGNEIGMIFQEPMTSLNPVFTIGNQMNEVFKVHQKLNTQDATAKSIEMLKLVNIPAPEKRMQEYPHQLSGGMRQRIMIGMALACQPHLLIADEPTTALDVTIQAQILSLMVSLQKELGMAILMITHDMGVVAELCDYVIVMYAGQIIEKAPVKDIFLDPKHPYTQGLLNSIPKLGEHQSRLSTIEGVVPNLSALPKGCRFRERCPKAMSKCAEVVPKPVAISSEREVSCLLYEKD